MTALRVVTVDDEPLARERLTDLVRATEGLQLVGEAANGLEALDLIARLKPDLVFIDVEMPELSGFAAIAALEDDAAVPGVVFVTAFERYAVKAFDVGAIDYLHKPVSKQRFAAAVIRARERLSGRAGARPREVVLDAARLEHERGRRTRFVVHHNHAHYVVPVDDVDWVQVADNYLQLHTGDRTHLWRGTLNSLVQEVDPRRFVRIHRSILVAVDRIGSVRPRASGGYVITLRTGMVLDGSRRCARELRGFLLHNTPAL